MGTQGDHLLRDFLPAGIYNKAHDSRCFLPEKEGCDKMAVERAIHDTEFIMKPTVDYCFKELMKNRKTRQGFIAALLGVDPESVADTELLDPMLYGEYPDEKLGILDVRVRLLNGTQMDLEMQLGYYAHWTNRVLFYLSRMYVAQLKKGEDYTACKKCIHVSILNFEQFPDEAYYRTVHLREDVSGALYSDLLEVQVLELPKLPKTPQNEEGSVERWMRFFSGKKKEDFVVMAETDPYLKEAYDALMQLSADEGKRLYYEAREKALRDHYSFLKSAREEGREEGRREAARRDSEIARRYYVAHETPEQIAAGLNCDIETVKEFLQL